MRESVTIRSHATGTNNTMSSYPGSSGSGFSNLRGMGERLAMLFIDEFAFFDSAGMPVILPLLANGAALVMTSSVAPGGSREGIMAILDAKYADGSKAVLELNWMQSCDACKRAGRSDRCAHITQPPQHFQRRADQERLRALLAVCVPSPPPSFYVSSGVGELTAVPMVHSPTRAPTSAR